MGSEMYLCNITAPTCKEMILPAGHSEASLEGIHLQEYAKTHKELELALGKWLKK